MPTTIEWLDGQHELDEIGPAWDALAASASPFVTSGWIAAWWRAFGRGRLRVCAAFADGHLVAALPLVERRGILTSPTNAHTPSFQPIGSEEYVATILQAVLAIAPGTLVVEHLPVSAPVVADLSRASREAKRLTWIEPSRESPVIETVGDYDTYLAGRGRHVRRDLARLRRKLDAEHEIVITPLQSPADPAAALEEILELEAGGWKGRRGTAILQSEAASAFYREVAGRWAATGDLRISSLRVEGELAAADLCVLSHGRVWIPKGAFDERFARYSPGRILLLAEVEKAFEEGLDGVELLGDADAYKLSFATSARSLCTVHSGSRAVLPAARIRYRRTIRPRLRSAYRSLRSQ